MKKEQRTQETRERLVRTAARLFAERGFDGVSLETIATEAQVNKALVSYHFGGKRGLYTAVILEVLRDTKPALERVRASELPPRERLGEFVDMMAGFIQQHPSFPFILLREEMSGGPNLEPGVMDEFLEFFRVDRKILEDGIASGDFRPVDPHAAHLTLVGALIFFFVTQDFRGQWKEKARMSDPKLNAYVEHLKQFLLGGLAPGPDSF